jgi:hypothetical protein
VSFSTVTHKERAARISETAITAKEWVKAKCSIWTKNRSRIFFGPVALLGLLADVCCVMEKLCLHPTIP